ncbi:UNVERIFIED_CONTAM: hypothetical protein Scaly_3061100 [Sesamum calycinum]|uniref:Uncharacterized protein n=1 Tax=Sesamum calycinum TaxID=2727403 RepID=A0AAW2K056_9LAMI
MLRRSGIGSRYFGAALKLPIAERHGRHSIPQPNFTCALGSALLLSRGKNTESANSTTFCFNYRCKSARARTVGSGGGAGSGGVRNDSEETEVAEFLVELPTKTLRMDNPNPARSSLSRRPFRLWTDIPMEERVHVQGVPGGEPGLFSGMKMSSVFGPELWKCAGYVPKKLNFRYTEFPCLSHGKIEEKKEEEVDKTSGEENANQADNNAGVLFSITKENENSLPTPIVDSHGVKSPVECDGCPEVVSSRQKKLDGQNLVWVPRR